MGISITGFDELAERVNKLSSDNEIRETVLVAAAQELLPVIKANASTAFVSRKNRIMRSLGHKVTTSRGKVSVKVGSIGKKAPHAWLVEHGHGGPHPAGAHPFLEPAYESQKDHITQVIHDKYFELLKENI